MLADLTPSGSDGECWPGRIEFSEGGALSWGHVPPPPELGPDHPPALALGPARARSLLQPCQRILLVAQYCSAALQRQLERPVPQSLPAHPRHAPQHAHLGRHGLLGPQLVQSGKVEQQRLRVGRPLGLVSERFRYQGECLVELGLIQERDGQVVDRLRSGRGGRRPEGQYVSAGG